eukprot:augustus_masked-scaffold_6-processed-gene-12.36-mRNA-1 protein AED:1.00 eAED:1.00 QI:0/0/0/0/1/1/3/0/786
MTDVTTEEEELSLICAKCDEKFYDDVQTSLTLWRYGNQIAFLGLPFNLKEVSVLRDLSPNPKFELEYFFKDVEMYKKEVQGIPSSFLPSEYFFRNYGNVKCRNSSCREVIGKITALCDPNGCILFDPEKLYLNDISEIFWVKHNFDEFFLQGNEVHQKEVGMSMNKYPKFCRHLRMISEELQRLRGRYKNKVQKYGLTASLESYLNTVTAVEPRDYQKKIFLDILCREENGLVCLPVGHGKTIVAIMVMEYLLNLNPDHQAVFIVETNSLAIQQFEVIENFLGKKFGVKRLVGTTLDDETSFKKKGRKGSLAHREKDLNLCADIEVIQTVLQIKLLCQRLGDARVYFNRNAEEYNRLLELPKVMPMETPIISRTPFEKRFMEAVVKYILREISVIGFQYSGPFAPCRGLLAYLGKTNATRFNRKGVGGKIDVDIVDLFNSLIDLDEVGTISTYRLIELLPAFETSKNEENMQTAEKEGFLFGENKITCNCIAQLLKEQRLRNVEDGSAYVAIKTTLLSALNEAQEKNVHVLIFVSTRFACKSLCHALNRDAAFFEQNVSMKADFIVGRQWMDLATQRKKLQNFRTGEVNVLISTSVCSEGIDFPECNLVLCSTLPVSALTYVQIRGRLRVVSKHGVTQKDIDKSRFVGLVRSTGVQPDVLKDYFTQKEKNMYMGLIKYTNEEGVLNVNTEYVSMKRKAVSVSNEDFTPVLVYSKNARSALNEICQKRSLSTPGYNYTSSGLGFECICTLKVLDGRLFRGKGKGPSKKSAQEIAAKSVLDKIRASWN